MCGPARLCQREDSVLLVVDIQERLAAAMLPEAREQVIWNTGILLEAAVRLGVPRFLSEQYPKGLGQTEAGVLAKSGDGLFRFEKTCFSCGGDEEFGSALRQTGRRQVVVAGMEAHVCVFQTAMELHAEGYEVYVAGDAICSRNPTNRENALDRLRQAGLVVTNTESVVFEWLRDSRHEQFKAISALVR